jgi:hypothetical protein
MSPLPPGETASIASIPRPTRASERGMPCPETIEERPAARVRTSFARSSRTTWPRVAHAGVVTRFPPEPNGYLHIGHAKAITLSFSVAKEFGGRCNLRMDDTNPAAEDQEYVDAIKEDVRWLGFEWDAMFYAADYFDQIYAWAEQLVEKGLAYVDDQNADQIAATRGTLTTPGARARAAAALRRGEPRLLREHEGRRVRRRQKVLRAKIDMAHANLNLRDPVMYRIRHMHHHRTGDRGASTRCTTGRTARATAIEGITHSLCTLEFEHHRPLYDWFCDTLGIYKPAADRVRAAQRRVHADQQAQAAAAGRRPATSRLGRPAHADAARPAPPRLCRPQALRRVLQARSAWRSSTARTRSACSSSSCATTSTSTRSGAWSCSTRSSW